MHRTHCMVRFSKRVVERESLAGCWLRLGDRFALWDFPFHRAGGVTIGDARPRRSIIWLEGNRLAEILEALAVFGSEPVIPAEQVGIMRFWMNAFWRVNRRGRGLSDLTRNRSGEICLQ